MRTEPVNTLQYKCTEPGNTEECRCTEPVNAVQYRCIEPVNAVQYRCTVTAHLVEAEQWLLGGGAPVTSAGAAAHWAPGRILVIFTR